MIENVFVRQIHLPMTVRAFTIPDEHGNYNVYINDRLSTEQQYKSLEHEFSHIRSGDFSKDEKAAAIEAAAKRNESA